jgi:hypothetical protein
MAVETRHDDWKVIHKQEVLMNRQHIFGIFILVAVLVIAASCGQTPTALPAEPTGTPTESTGEQPTAAGTPTAEPTVEEPKASETPSATPPAATPEDAPTATPTQAAEDEGTPVEGWIGTVRDLPPGNQFGQVFVREDGEEYDIGATNDAAWDVIMEAKETGAQIKVWGTLYTGVPASEARHIEVERVSVP